MKINLFAMKDNLKGNWWHHIQSINFGFLAIIDDMKDHDVEQDDILIHKEIKEGDRFPTIRYHVIRGDGNKEMTNEEVKEILSKKLVEFVKKSKKLPFACKFVKVFKNDSVQINYNPTQYDKFALKIVPKKYGIENGEKFFNARETAENPVKVSAATKIKPERTREWHLESSSESGKLYTITLHYNGSWECTCPQYVFRKKECKHIAQCKIEL